MSDKFFAVHFYGHNKNVYKTYDEAVIEAKKRVGRDNDGDDYFIMESVAKAIAPVPEIEIVKL